MKKSIFDEVIETVVKKSQASSGTSNTGMEYDLNHYFENGAAIHLLSVNHTESVKCLFSINLEITEKANSLREVFTEIHNALNECLYSDLYATSSKAYKQKSIIRFVSAPEGSEYYVTGKVEVSGDLYRDLVSKYEAEDGEFGEFPNT